MAYYVRLDGCTNGHGGRDTRHDAGRAVGLRSIKQRGGIRGLDHPSAATRHGYDRRPRAGSQCGHSVPDLLGT